MIFKRKKKKKERGRHLAFGCPHHGLEELPGGRTTLEKRAMRTRTMGQRRGTSSATCTGSWQAAERSRGRAGDIQYI